MKSDRTLDCYGLICPMPLFQTAKALREMKAGQILEVLSTDGGIESDMPAWCRKTGHEFLGAAKQGDVFKAYVRKVKD